MEIYVENGIEYNSFIYRWKDIKYEKYYIGSHIGHIKDGYKFGGIDIKKEYINRVKDFEREILSYHIVSSNFEIRKIEKEYLIKYDVENNTHYYNRTNESYGGYHKKSVDNRLNDIDENGFNHFQRAAKKMVKTRKQKGNYKSAKIKEYMTKLKDSKRYDKMKKKISDSLKGSKWVHKNEISKYVDSKSYKNYINEGWENGKIEFVSYEECYSIARLNNIKSAKEWYDNYDNFENVPSHPERVYKEWNGWYSFLKKNKKEFVSYEECSSMAIVNNIKSAKEWYKFVQDKNNNILPYHPNRKYKEKWNGWVTFLGK